MPHQFKPPWTVHNNESSFWVEDATGMRFGYVYYGDRPQAGTSAMKPTRDEARRLAANIAKLPQLLKAAPEPRTNPPESR